jgi:hypothetical protein
MKKRILLLLFLLFLLLSQPLAPQLSLAAKIDVFTVSPTSISLPDQDPDLFPEVSTATDVTAAFSISKLKSGQNWILEIYSDGNLISGSDTIPIANVRWTVTGSGTPSPSSLQNGTFSLGVYQETGRGLGDSSGNATVSCYFRFHLSNLWAYATGNYSKLITLRLTVQAPAGDVVSRTFTLSVNLASRAKLEFGSLALSFLDSNPDIVLSVPANVNPLAVTSSTRTGSSLTTALTCLASGDLTLGSNTIPIGNMIWTATGSGYVAGTMSKATGQAAGSWAGPGKRVGTFSYYLASSWLYITGVYSTTITYTLTGP